MLFTGNLHKEGRVMCRNRDGDVYLWDVRPCTLQVTSLQHQARVMLSRMFYAPDQPVRPDRPDHSARSMGLLGSSGIPNRSTSSTCTSCFTPSLGVRTASLPPTCGTRSTLGASTCAPLSFQSLPWPLTARGAKGQPRGEVAGGEGERQRDGKLGEGERQERRLEKSTFRALLCAKFRPSALTNYVLFTQNPANIVHLKAHCEVC